MRAAVTVEGLARACNLTIAVVPAAGPDVDQRDLGWAAERSERCILVRLPAPADAARQWLAHPDGRAAVAAAQPLPGRARLACPGLGLREIGDRAFDLVWTMRLYLAGVALPHRGRTGRMVIDLDEDDAATHRAIADLHHRRGELAAAARLAAEADAYERLADHAARWFDQIVTATDQEFPGLPRALERRDDGAQCGEGQPCQSPSASRPRTTVGFVRRQPELSAEP